MPGSSITGATMPVIVALSRAVSAVAAVAVLAGFTGSGATADGCVRLRFETTPEAIDINAPAQITTTLSRGVAPECDAAIDGLAVTASMPQHGHGLPTRPV